MKYSNQPSQLNSKARTTLFKSNGHMRLTKVEQNKKKNVRKHLVTKHNKQKKALGNLRDISSIYMIMGYEKLYLEMSLLTLILSDFIDQPVVLIRKKYFSFPTLLYIDRIIALLPLTGLFNVLQLIDLLFGLCINKQHIKIYWSACFSSMYFLLYCKIFVVCIFDLLEKTGEDII